MMSDAGRDQPPELSRSVVGESGGVSVNALPPPSFRGPLTYTNGRPDDSATAIVFESPSVTFANLYPFFVVPPVAGSTVAFFGKKPRVYVYGVPDPPACAMA